MVYVFLDALVHHHFTYKEVEENLGQVKGSAFHQMVQNKLVGVRQKIL